MSFGWYTSVFCFVGLPCFGAIFGTVTADLGVSDLVLDDARGKLYLINNSRSQVDVYSTTQRKFLTPITTGTNPLAGAMSPDGNFLYVTAYAQTSLNVIDLNKGALIQRIALQAAPEGVAVAADGKVLITTIGTGQNNLFNTLLVYDPNGAQGAQISSVAITVTGPTAPVQPPLGLTPLSVRSALLATDDHTKIIGVNNISNTTRSVFVYEASAGFGPGTILAARTVTGISNVLSISPDGSRFMAGLTLFDTDTLNVRAQQNAANAPFSFPSTNATNFNTQQNQGGSVFSPDGTILYSAFNIAPIQNPPAAANVTRLLLNDPDNLLINLGLQLKENLAGKMVITKPDGGTIYALSQSGFVTLPVSMIYQNPIAMPSSSVALLGNDQCGVSTNNQAGLSINNAGRGRMTATAQLLSLPTATTTGLGGAGGPGGGGPGGGFTVFIPPALLGRGAPAGVTAAAGFGNANTSVLQTSPLLNTQQNGDASNLTFGYNSVNAKTLGTVTPHSFLIQSLEAINIPGNIQIFQNNHDSDARAKITPMAVNASSAEGLVDMIVEHATPPPVRRKLRFEPCGSLRYGVTEIYDADQSWPTAPFPGDGNRRSHSVCRQQRRRKHQRRGLEPDEANRLDPVSTAAF